MRGTLCQKPALVNLKGKAIGCIVDRISGTEKKQRQVLGSTEFRAVEGGQEGTDNFRGCSWMCALGSPTGPQFLLAELALRVPGGRDLP